MDNSTTNSVSQTVSPTLISTPTVSPTIPVNSTDPLQPVTTSHIIDITPSETGAASTPTPEPAVSPDLEPVGVHLSDMAATNDSTIPSLTPTPEPINITPTPTPTPTPEPISLTPTSVEPVMTPVTPTAAPVTPVEQVAPQAPVVANPLAENPDLVQTVS